MRSIIWFDAPPQMCRSQATPFSHVSARIPSLISRYQLPRIHLIQNTYFYNRSYTHSLAHNLLGRNCPRLSWRYECRNYDGRVSRSPDTTTTTRHCHKPALKTLESVQTNKNLKEKITGWPTWRVCLYVMCKFRWPMERFVLRLPTYDKLMRFPRSCVLWENLCRGEALKIAFFLYLFFCFR